MMKELAQEDDMHTTSIRLEQSETFVKDGNENEKPPQVLANDYLPWSIFTLMFCNVLCLGWIPLSYSLKARDAADRLDVSSCRDYSRKASYWNRGLAIAGFFVLVILVILISRFVFNVPLRIRG